MLDMAYENYMQCPVGDSSVKNLLYNLGLDFERKRMFNKALAIYEHIRTGGTFKDIKKRIDRLRVMEDPLALSVGKSAGEKTMVMDDTNTHPTFGRYEILRELGRGAMGTVYLGRDPKINREVAIKTLEYGEVAGDELADVKARFFREAEAAGKLSHPNIVAIYDAGEEHDMAYIAMELLVGEDLTRYCRPENLLPQSRAIDIVVEVTSALDYAHQQGVIHRDIKPANIMMLKDGRIKVTDFGIARVVDASQTKTGIILGTPSYMSPEQVAGKDVDGRSDLFALGTVFYQLLGGTKPFGGDSLTAILYAITHKQPTPLSEIVPDIDSCIERIVNRLLTKGVTRRFQSATQVLKAIDECRKI
jgi:serine/threonine-protein kinase